MSELSEAIAFVEAELAVVTERAAQRMGDDPANWHARRRVEMTALAARIEVRFHARISDRYDGARVRLLGISSTSTMGLAGALRNWLNAARAKAGAS